MLSHKGCKVLTWLMLLGGLWLSLMTSSTAVAQETWKSPDWLMDPARAKQFIKTEYFKVKPLFRSASLTAETTKQIRQVVHYYLSVLTHEETIDHYKTVDRLLNELSPTLTSPAVRQVIMEETVARAAELMNHPRPLVRYNVLSAVVQLNVRPATNVGLVETPAVPFAPAHKLLVQVVKDANQSLAARILAAKGLTRICRDGDGTPSSPEKSDIAEAAVATLNATPPSITDDGIWWFRGKLIEVLGSVDRIDNTATSPIVIETLLDVIKNRNELPVNRALAAQCITQLPFTSSTNVRLITDEIMKLLGELCAAYLKTPNAPRWHESFVRLYLAFKPATERQARDLKWGLLFQVTRTGLTNQADYVKGAWGVAFPILRPFIERGPTPPPPREVKALTEWLQKVDPASRRVVPNGKEYSTSAAAVMVTGGGTN